MLHSLLYSSCRGLRFPAICPLILLRDIIRREHGNISLWKFQIEVNTMSPPTPPTVTFLDDRTLVLKCLELTQTLAFRGSTFKISIKLSGGFNYFVTTIEPSNTSSNNLRKNKSLSTIHRNVARREEIFQKKESISIENVNPEATDSFMSIENPLCCKTCGYEARNPANIKKHEWVKHSEIKQLDGNDTVETANEHKYRCKEHNKDFENEYLYKLHHKYFHWKMERAQFILCGSYVVFHPMGCFFFHQFFLN